MRSHSDPIRGSDFCVASPSYHEAGYRYAVSNVVLSTAQFNRPGGLAVRAWNVRLA